jgi:hypothetical protein
LPHSGSGAESQISRYSSVTNSIQRDMTSNGPAARFISSSKIIF